MLTYIEPHHNLDAAAVVRPKRASVAKYILFPSSDVAKIVAIQNSSKTKPNPPRSD